MSETSIGARIAGLASSFVLLGALGFFVWRMIPFASDSLRKSPTQRTEQLVIDSIHLTSGSSIGLANHSRRSVIYLFRTTCPFCERIHDSVGKSLAAVGGLDVFTLSSESADSLGGYWNNGLVADAVDTATSLWARSAVPALLLVESDGVVARIWMGADSVSLGLQVIDSLVTLVTLKPLAELAYDVVFDQEAWFARNGSYAEDPASLPIIQRLAGDVVFTQAQYALGGKGYVFVADRPSREEHCTITIMPHQRSGVSCS